MVDLEKVIVPVSMFFNTFKDLQHQAGASGIKFTCMSYHFKDNHFKTQNLSQLPLLHSQI